MDKIGNYTISDLKYRTVKTCNYGISRINVLESSIFKRRSSVKVDMKKWLRIEINVLIVLV